ncbi:hypothetical protein PV05_02103 [Exophiala xenobiotica]|uniref:Beta-lactamase-related domain-containing protein n=1 Tax=Exophiala xenobiotica TaxID=348802 RepID=A0A0D2CAQ8_9EURO|nr:uncharacterized protein PV05_02103 [Exophiala xenobiotica]KIW62051.1 hypothetical protein PV05_02103 [Exophiala xenobiotica]
MTSSAVQGHCDPQFDEIKRLFQGYLDSGAELGASITVNVAGHDVVDLYGGWVDSAHSKPWQQDTIVNVYSTTKEITSFAALLLVDRGQLDINAPVAQYWPEFAQNGKSNILIRHLLSHTSGVAGWQEPVTVDDVLDVPKSTALLAEQAPWWSPPGTAAGYHSLTYGHLIGEVVRRITGKTLGQFMTDEICKPLDADFQLGAREEDYARVSDVVPPPVPATLPVMQAGSIKYKVFTNPVLDSNGANTRAWRQAEMGAGNGHSNSQGLARILSVISLGGKKTRDDDGTGTRTTPFLSPSTVDLIFQEQFKGTDLVIDLPVRLGVGYGLTSPQGDTMPDFLPPAGRVCFWGGYGGSVGIMDLDRKLTITYAMNKMENAGMGNERSIAYVRAVYRAMS